MLSARPGKFLRTQRFSNVMSSGSEQNSLTVKIQPGKGAMERVHKLLSDIMHQSQVSNKSRRRRNQSANLKNFGRKR